MDSIGGGESLRNMQYNVRIPGVCYGRILRGLSESPPSVPICAVHQFRIANLIVMINQPRPRAKHTMKH